MALMDEAVWRGKVYSGGWIGGAGGDAAVIEPATGQEIGRTGIATPEDVAHAAQVAAAAQPAWAATPHTVPWHSGQGCHARPRAGQADTYRYRAYQRADRR